MANLAKSANSLPAAWLSMSRVPRRIASRISVALMEPGVLLPAISPLMAEAALASWKPGWATRLRSVVILIHSSPPMPVWPLLLAALAAFS